MAPAERLWNTDRPWAALDRMIRAVGIEIVPHDQRPRVAGATPSCGAAKLGTRPASIAPTVKRATEQ